MGRAKRAALAAICLLAGGAASDAAPSVETARATIRADRSGPAISRYLFSQFAEHIGAGIYGGLWVGRNSPIPNMRGMRTDVLAALRALHVPLVRWPGGCFADIYHWRDGVGPAAKRRARINSHWGGILEPNSFGTDEFMAFVQAIGAEAYLNGNVGTAAPDETTGWLEYLTATQGDLAAERAANGHPAPYAIKFWGIGNELWGCGGRMRADYAADLTRRYSQFIQVPAGTRPLLVASGPDAQDYAWTDTMMRVAGDRIDAVALHYYTIPDRKGAFGSGTDFDEASYARTLGRTRVIDELLTRHAAVMDKYDPARRVDLAVDEWGVLTDVVPGHPPRSLFMQNSLRDALLASLNFDIFIRHADRVRMAAIAQMINVAQSMILTDGPRMVLTPTFHAFAMYVPFQDATSLPMTIDTPDYVKGEWRMPAVDGAAARDAAGVVHVALTNVDPTRAIRLSATFPGLRAGAVTGRVLTAPMVTAHNDFGTQASVVPRLFGGASWVDGALVVDLPPRSLVVLDLSHDAH